MLGKVKFFTLNDNTADFVEAPNLSKFYLLRKCGRVFYNSVEGEALRQEEKSL